jgi:hypothetical protein
MEATAKSIQYTVGFCEDENLKWRKSMEVLFLCQSKLRAERL